MENRTDREWNRQEMKQIENRLKIGQIENRTDRKQNGEKT